VTAIFDNELFAELGTSLEGESFLEMLPLVFVLLVRVDKLSFSLLELRRDPDGPLIIGELDVVLVEFLRDTSQDGGLAATTVSTSPSLSSLSLSFVASSSR
jgi:hypothetical protein